MVCASCLLSLFIQVLATTFDGASTNRSLVKFHDQSGSFVHSTPNPYAPDERNLYFFSDPPHLIKTQKLLVLKVEISLGKILIL